MACFTRWLWLGRWLSFHGAVGAYWTLRILSVIEVVLDALLEPDVLFVPKKDWNNPTATLAPMAPATLIPPHLRA